MKLTRRQFLQLSSVVGGVLLTGICVPVTATQEVDMGLEFPLDFPIAFSSPTQLGRQPSSTSIFGLRSTTFWEKLFSK
jgi:hypothetical protein